MSFWQEGAARPATEACPVTGFDHRAIAWSVPAILKEAAASIAVGQGEHLPVARIWATLLAAAALQGMSEHFLLQVLPVLYVFSRQALYFMLPKSELVSKVRFAWIGSV